MPALGLALGLPFVPSWKSGDALTTWLDGATYADWNPTKLDRMFTASIGPTSVASNGDADGLLFDGSQLGGLTLPAYTDAQADILTSAWTLTVVGAATATESPAGTLNLTGVAGDVARADKNFTSVNGQWYRVRFTTSAFVGLLVGTSSGNGNYLNIGPTAGTYSYFFRAASTSGGLRFYISSGSAVVSNITCKPISGFHAIQATAGDRPIYQSGYLRGDGTSDNLLTTWVCGGAGNTLIMRRTGVAAGAIRIGAGTSGSSAGRFFVGQDAAGAICGGVGDNSTDVVLGATSIASADCVIAITEDDTTVKLFCYKAGVVTEEYSDAIAGTPSTTIPVRLCAYNNNGTAASFDSGDVGRVIAAQKAMSLAEFTAIAPLLAA